MSYTPSHSPKRLRWLARFGLLWAFALVAQLVNLQFFRHDEYQKQADRQQNRDLVVEAPRGEILDRNGRLLAMNVPVQSAVLNLEGIEPHPVAMKLAKALNLPAAALEASIRMSQEAGLNYISVKRRLLPEEVKAVDALGIPQIAYRPETKRIYPNGSLAANLIGWVNEAGDGVGGLELAVNSALKGTPGRMQFVMDSRRHRAGSEVTIEPKPGYTLVTTIDARIQNVADEALKKAVIDNHCMTGSVTVMDPNTGEILAMSSYPTFDPNEPVKKDALGDRVNQAIANRYEPGSVFKTITFSAALESTGLRPTDIINCGNGVWRGFGRVIHDHNSYSSLPAVDVLAKSSNVGTINIAMKVGLDKLVSTVNDFGFGSKPGLGLPGEAAGLVPRYKEGSLGYVAIGHEISVTNVQLARAASAIANGGYLITPRVVAAMRRTSEEVLPKEGKRVRIIRPETSITMRQMMEHTVLKGGTGTSAKFPGYTVGGKTGSAQIFDFATGHYSHEYNASFMGFSPLTNPNIVVVVTLNGAHQYGGVVAAPVFAEVAAAAMRVREIRRDVPDDPGVLVGPQDLVTDLSDAPERPDLRAGDLKVDPKEMETAAATVGPRVPDFRGKTLTAAVSQSVALGMTLDIRGRGLVRRQSPAPGAVLGAGEKVRLTFAP